MLELFRWSFSQLRYFVCEFPTILHKKLIPNLFQAGNSLNQIPIYFLNSEPVWEPCYINYIKWHYLFLVNNTHHFPHLWKFSLSCFWSQANIALLGTFILYALPLQAAISKQPCMFLTLTTLVRLLTAILWRM